MLTLRLGLYQTDVSRARELAEAIVRQKGSCDEVWLTTRGNFPPMDYHRTLAESWVQAAEIFRAAGLRVALQIANTIGHRDWASTHPDEFSYFALGMRENGELYDRLTGPDGVQCHSCFCWRGERFRRYINDLVQIYSQRLQPDCIWLDDDLRAFSHKPIEFGCFCDSCLAQFNAQHGTDYTREALVHEINYGDTAVRERFLDFTKEGIRNFLFGVVKACHEVSPTTHFGFEYAHTKHYPDVSENFIVEALHEASGLSVELRPGGGFYNDKAPYGEYTKALLISSEITDLPACVDSVKAEIENLPGVVFGKSIGGIINEGTLDLAYGCTGLTFTDVQSSHEPMEYYERIFKRFSAVRPYWERLAELSRTTAHGGAAIYRSPKAHLRPLVQTEVPFSWADIHFEGEYNWTRLGLPITFDRRRAAVYLLHHADVGALTDADIHFLLQHPVVADAESVQALIERGYADRFDFTLKENGDPDATEHFVEHAVNGRWAGYFLQENPYANTPMKRFTFENMGESTEAIGKVTTSLLDCEQREYGASAVITSIRNTDGGRVKWAVFGYSIWSDLTSAAKRNQLAGAMDVIAVMPARLMSEDIAALIPAVNDEGRTAAVTVSSVSQSGTEEMRLLVRRPVSDTVTAYTSRNRPFLPRCVRHTEEEAEWLLPPIDPYEIVTLFFE